MSQIDPFDLNNQNVARDLRLAGEIGNSLLIRNKELEHQLKIANQTSSAQSRDINLLTRQAKALRLTHECRLRVFEDADKSAQTLEQKCITLESVLERYKTENRELRGSVKNLENEVLDNRLTIQELERTHQGTLMKTDVEKQDFNAAREASKRVEEALNMSIETLRFDLTTSCEELASCRHRLSSLESANLRLGQELDDSIAAEQCANSRADQLAQELRRLQQDHHHHHRRRNHHHQHHRRCDGEEQEEEQDEEEEYKHSIAGGGVTPLADEHRQEEIDNVSLLGELLQLKEQVALQDSMCSTVPPVAYASLDTSTTSTTTAAEQEGEEQTSHTPHYAGLHSSTTAVSSPPEYKRLFEEIFRTLRRRPTTAALHPNNGQQRCRSVATNTEG